MRVRTHCSSPSPRSRHRGRRTAGETYAALDAELAVEVLAGLRRRGTLAVVWLCCTRVRVAAAPVIAV